MPTFKKSYEINQMKDQWSVVHDCYSGNKEIKKKSNQETYLPRFGSTNDSTRDDVVVSGESLQAYERRVKSAVFENFIEPSVNVISQAPFKRQITYDENFNEKYKKIISENSDLKKTSFQDYLENSLRSCLLYGVHASFVDYGEDRPFFESVTAPQILGAWQSYIDGKFVLSRFIFFKDILVQKDSISPTEAYEENVYRRVIDLIYPNTLRIYEIRKDLSYDAKNLFNGKINYTFNETDDFKFVEEIKLNTTELPIHLLFADERLGAVYCKVPFFDNCLLNIQQYQKSSNRDSIVLVSGFPMMKAKGIAGQDLENFDGSSGPHRLYLFKDPKADISFIEPQGNSIREIREDLKSIEAKITLRNYEWLSGRRNEVTATSELIDENNKNTRTKNLALYVNEYANKLLKNFGEYESMSESEIEDFKISINTDIEYLPSQTKVQAISDAYKSGAISIETYTKRLVELEVLSADFDPVEDKQKIEEAFSIFRANNDNENASQENENTKQGEQDA